MTAKANAPSYRPDIDGLRAVALCAVLVFHLKRDWLPGGFVGVDIFFVISGYLITGILMTDLASGKFSFGRFYRRRAARILPAQMLVIVATMIAGLFVYSAQDFASLGAAGMAAAVSLINMKLLFQGSYFDISPDSQPLLHFWSLAVEEQFYLGFPLLLFLLSFLRPGWTRWALLGIAAISLAACVALTPAYPSWAFYLLPTRAWELLAGGLLVAFRVDERAISAGLANAMGYAGAALVVVSLLVLDEGAAFPGISAALPVAGAALLLAAGGRGTHVGRLLGTRLPVAIGLVSYSLYLWHWPVYSMVDYALFASPEGQRMAIKLALTLVLSVASYKLVERPMRRRLRERGMGRTLAAGSVAAIALVIAAGYHVRTAYYPAADDAAIADGSVVYGNPVNGRVVLVGDSQAAMYARQLALMAGRDGFELTILAKPDANLLPDSDNSLWPQALRVIERTQPDLVIIADAWISKIDDRPERLCQALSEIAPMARHALVFTQPPTLPMNTGRANVRAGDAPFFREDPAVTPLRTSLNSWIAGLDSPAVRVIDVGSFMVQPDGSVGYVLPTGRAAFQDAGHISDAAVATLAPQISAAISGLLADDTAGLAIAAAQCHAP